MAPPQIPEKLAQITRIAKVNDNFRATAHHLIIAILNSKHSHLSLSPAIAKLRTVEIIWIVEAVANWTDEDPHSERKYGEVTARIFNACWKIDYFDSKTKISKRSANPNNPSATNRVLSLKLREEDWTENSILL